MDLEEAIAQFARDGAQVIKGIDWDALDQQGKGIPLDPSIEIRADNTSYLYLYMSPALARASRVMSTLYFDPEITNHAVTKEAIRTVAAEILPTIEEVGKNWALGNYWGAMSAAFAFDLVKLRTFISLAYGIALEGTKLHTAETNYAIAFLDRKSWREHADRVTRILNAITFLDDAKALYWLKWDSDQMKELRANQGLPVDMKNPMQGLGWVPPLALIVAAAAVIVCLGAIWAWASTTSQYNEQSLGILRQICADPKDQATRDQCMKVLGTPQIGNPFAGAISSVMPYLFAGVLIAGGVFFLPTIVRSFLKARSVAHEGAH
jgi:hypothetical protein